MALGTSKWEEIDGFPTWSVTHVTLMSTAWVLLENLVLWSILFKNYRYGQVLHIIFAGLLASGFFLGVLLMLVYTGFQQIRNNPHDAAGFSLLCIFPVLIVTGGMTKLTQISIFRSPRFVITMNWIHFLFGWAMIIFSKFTYYMPWLKGDKTIFLSLVIPDMTSHLLFIIIKLYIICKEADYFMRKKEEGKDLRVIKSGKDLNVYGNNYYIFADKVYDISHVVNTHPGGMQII